MKWSEFLSKLFFICIIVCIMFPFLMVYYESGEVEALRGIDLIFENGSLKDQAVSSGVFMVLFAGIIGFFMVLTPKNYLAELAGAAWALVGVNSLVGVEGEVAKQCVGVRYQFGAYLCMFFLLVAVVNGLYRARVLIKNNSV